MGETNGVAKAEAQSRMRCPHCGQNDYLLEDSGQREYLAHPVYSGDDRLIRLVCPECRKSWGGPQAARD